MTSLGEKVLEERTQQRLHSGDVAAQAGITVDVLSNIENGSYYPQPFELDGILRALNRPLTWITEGELPVIARRYASIEQPKRTLFDRGLETLAHDLRYLLDQGIVRGTERKIYDRPRTHDQAALLAKQIRNEVGLSIAEPIVDIAQICESFGLYEFAADFSDGYPCTAGAMIEVTSTNGSAAIGTALVDSGRYAFIQRFVLAHELCHWLIGDDFEANGAMDSDSFSSPRDPLSRTRSRELISEEEACNSFAAHFLFPAEATDRFIGLHTKLGTTDAAVELALSYGLGWRSTVGLLHNAGHFDRRTAQLLWDQQEPDARICSTMSHPDKNRVRTSFLSQLEKAVEDNLLDYEEAQSYAYGVPLP